MVIPSFQAWAYLFFRISSTLVDLIKWCHSGFIALLFGVINTGISFIDALNFEIPAFRPVNNAGLQPEWQAKFLIYQSSTHSTTQIYSNPLEKFFRVLTAVQTDQKPNSIALFYIIFPMFSFSCLFVWYFILFYKGFGEFILFFCT